MKVKLLNEDPYGEIICKYFATSFSKVFTPNSKQLLDILTTILIGDKNTRLGPVPAPEETVEIRKVISYSIENNMPIPILVAWGGVKTVRDANIDMAEIAAIQQLVKLDEAVKTFYPMGTRINVRIEDLGADWIYRGEENISTHIENYSNALNILADMLTGESNISFIRESLLMDEEIYFAKSKDLSEIIEKIVSRQVLDGNNQNIPSTLQVIKAKENLKLMGWQGDLPAEQIDHYIGRYKILYPNKQMSEYITMAADYLAGAKVRYDLNGRANPTLNRSFINISFIPPIPGAPASMFNTTLYYRTIPMNQGRTHIAPWRAKGYLEIDSQNNAKVKLTSWSNHEVIDALQPVKVEISNGNANTIVVDTDYFVREDIIPLHIL